MLIKDQDKVKIRLDICFTFTGLETFGDGDKKEIVRRKSSNYQGWRDIL